MPKTKKTEIIKLSFPQPEQEIRSTDSVGMPCNAMMCRSNSNNSKPSMHHLLPHPPTSLHTQPSSLPPSPHLTTDHNPSRP
jgi:hypothetical protein